MSITSETFCKELKQLGILPQNKLLLALSGGLDSIVLFHLLNGAKTLFSVAHVNYGLRNEDSSQDEAFCKDLCEKNGIPFFLYDAKSEMENRGSKISLQEKAREIRYIFFHTLIEAEGFDYILTAHHAHDSVETFFVNLIRGSGIQGLGGIPDKNGKIVRPLLAFSKAEMEAYAKENGLLHREDVSNAKDDYLRNRIRHHIIPALEKADDAAVNRIQESMGRLSSESDLLTFFMDQYFPESLAQTEKKTVMRFPEHLRATVLFKRFQSLGIHFSQAEDMALTLQGIPGKQFITPSHRILMDRDFIYAEEINGSDEETTILDDIHGKIKGYQLSVIPKEEFSISTEKNEAYLDIEKLTFPLIWRKIENGDYMIPFGMKGRKKISDILIDTKKTRFEKENLHVLCSGDEIVWLEGFRINDSSKITDTTCRVLCIIPEKL